MRPPLLLLAPAAAAAAGHAVHQLPAAGGLYRPAECAGHGWLGGGPVCGVHVCQRGGVPVLGGVHLRDHPAGGGRAAGTAGGEAHWLVLLYVSVMLWLSLSVRITGLWAFAIIQLVIGGGRAARTAGGAAVLVPRVKAFHRDACNIYFVVMQLPGPISL